MHMQVEDEPGAAGLPRCIRDAHTYECRATAALFCRLLLSLPSLSLLWNTNAQDGAVVEEMTEMDLEQAAGGRQQRGTAQRASAGASDAVLVRADAGVRLAEMLR